MRDYTAQIGPGQPYRLAARGRSFHVVKAASEVTVKLNDNDFQFTRTQGDTVVGIAFENIQLESAVVQTVTVCIGDGVSTSSNALTTGDITADIARASGIGVNASVTIAAGAVAQLIGSNTSRREVRIGLSSDQPNGVNFGGANTVDASKGGFLEVGAADYLTLTGEVWAFNNGSSSVTVNVLESIA